MNEEATENYVCFVNDRSGSIRKHREAMISDYNNMTKAFCDAVTEQMLDTVVSVVALGYPRGSKPTPSPIAPVKKPAVPTVDGKPVTLYNSRSEARASGKSVQDYFSHTRCGRRQVHRQVMQLAPHRVLNIYLNIEVIKMNEKLDIVCCSCEDTECYMSKGHHHFADFLKAAEEHLGEKPNGFDGPTHEWWRAIPAPRGSYYKLHYHPAKAGERGVFRVTVISRY